MNDLRENNIYLIKIDIDGDKDIGYEDIVSNEVILEIVEGSFGDAIDRMILRIEKIKSTLRGKSYSVIEVKKQLEEIIENFKESRSFDFTEMCDCFEYGNPQGEFEIIKVNKVKNNDITTFTKFK